VLAGGGGRCRGSASGASGGPRLFARGRWRSAARTPAASGGVWTGSAASPLRVWIGDAVCPPRTPVSILAAKCALEVAMPLITRDCCLALAQARVRVLGSAARTVRATPQAAP